MDEKKKLTFNSKLYILLIIILLLPIIHGYSSFNTIMLIVLILIQILFSIKNKTFWKNDLSEKDIKRIKELLLEANSNKEIIDIMKLDVHEQIIENIRIERFENLPDEYGIETTNEMINNSFKKDLKNVKKSISSLKKK